MTKHIGSILGAAMAAATFPGLHSAYHNGQVRRLAVDTVELASSAAENDTVSLAFLDWDTIIDRHSVIDFDDFGTGVNVDVGFANDPDALIDGQDVSTAAGSVNLLKSVAIENRHKRCWELAGYADRNAALDVAPTAELLLTFVGGDPAAGTLAWTIYGSPQ